MQAIGLVVIAGVLCAPAYGYIDPGTGSLLLQLQIAFAAGFLFYFKKIKTAVVAFFRKDKA